MSTTPVSPRQWLAAATALQRGGRAAEAERAYRNALAGDPGLAAAATGLAQVLLARGDAAGAHALLQRVPPAAMDATVMALQAAALMNLDRCREALPLWESLLARTPPDLSAAANHAICLARAGRRQEAVERCDALSRRAPPEAIAVRLANTLVECTAGDAATAALRRLRDLHPGNREIAMRLTEHLLLCRHWREGFACYRERWQHQGTASPAARLACPRWDGTPCAQLLVCAEQGIGDEVLYAGLFPQLVRRGQRATVSCDARILPAFARSFPSLAFVDRALAEPFAGADRAGGARAIDAGDLPGLLDPDGSGSPPHWLQASASRRADAARWLDETAGNRLRVGACWASTAPRGRFKSIPLPQLATLFAREDCLFVNLQYGDPAQEARQLPEGRLLQCPGLDPFGDTEGLLGLLAGLDVLVSVSNTNVHLAAALGVPCLVLLPDSRWVWWYWGYDGEATPWYPAVTLLRCRGEGDWSVPLAAAGARIDALAAARRNLPSG